MTNTPTLPLRRCVGVMLINEKRKVWIGRRISKPHDDPDQFVWQMPQGGIDDGETPEQAAVRELEEETGITSATILKQSAEWYSYELPTAIQGKALKGKYRGQTQKWFAMRFEGEEVEINIDEKPEHKAEFDQWKWENASRLPSLIVPFKRAVYQGLIIEFKDLLS